MNHRQWKKNYKKRYGYNPPAYMDKRKRRKARAQQSLPCAGISVEQITQAMETFTEAVFTAAGNICDALAQMFGRQAQAFNAVAEQYKDDKAEPAKIVHHKIWLTPKNIHEQSITLCWDNLEALCQDCHNKEHHAKNVRAKRYAFTADGELIPPIQKNIFHSR